MSSFTQTGSQSSGRASVASSPSTAPRPSALSNRLTSVLSASYADSDIRDALETLDERNVRNTAETRRQLRLDVQKEVIDSNGAIIKDFGKAAEQLKRIGTVIATLQQTCDEMRRHVTLSKQETGPVLEEASILIRNKEENETKQQLFDAFSKHFLIPEDDVVALTSSAEPIDSHFFEVLDRVKQIHHDCEVLLGGEHQRLGLEIMEQSSKRLNSAYQKLYKWIQREFKSLNLEDPHINRSIRKALRVLAERPSLFHSCLDFFAEARDNILLDAFHRALTTTASGSVSEATVKPIEFSAHDPIRYIGDMLAWVHSATVSEQEALEALFISEGDELARGIKAGISSEPWLRVDEDQGKLVFDGQKALNDLVDRDLNGVSRSLRQRVELVVQGHEDIVTTYKIVNLFFFYQRTFAKLVGPSSALVEVINSIAKYTFGHLENLLHDHASMVSADPSNHTPPSDLSIPPFLSDEFETLNSLMKAYDASVGSDITGDNSVRPENGFTPVLRAALDPFLELAQKASNTLRDHKQSIIYQANIFLAVRAVISPYQFAAATHLGPLSVELSSLRINLLDVQRSFLLETSGLQVLLSALEPFSSAVPPAALIKEQEKHGYDGDDDVSDNEQLDGGNEDSDEAEHASKNASTYEIQKINKSKNPTSNLDLETIASLPAFLPDALTATSQQLDDFLPSALMDATDNLRGLRSVALVKSVTEEAIEAFCRDFEFVEGMIIGSDVARGKITPFRIPSSRHLRLDGSQSDMASSVSMSVRTGIGGGEDERDEKDKDGQPSLRSLFPRTVGEIRVLLS